jgi:hypothetical protein
MDMREVRPVIGEQLGETAVVGVAQGRLSDAFAGLHESARKFGLGVDLIAHDTEWLIKQRRAFWRRFLGQSEGARIDPSPRHGSG